MPEKEEIIILNKGTIIKLNGIPFELASDTRVIGVLSNYNLALTLGNKEESNGEAQSS